MLLFIVLVFVSFLSALAYNIYSIFAPFYDTLNDIKQYNIAYYGAIGGIERAELVLKFRKAGFEGSGGWEGNNNFGPSSDQKINNFSFLSHNGNGLYRIIKSRVSSIPEQGKGNIEKQLRYTGSNYGGKSKNFNRLDYNYSEQFALFIDNCKDSTKYYGNCNSTINNITTGINITLRLPPKIFNKRGDEYLPDNFNDIDENGVPDDVIVNRSIFGSGLGKPFSIFPSIVVDYTLGNVESGDTAIRESIINNSMTSQPNIIFGDSKQPIIGKGEPKYHNIIPPDHGLSGETFNNIFSVSKDLYLKLSIVNLMKTNSNNIYPFLEYKIDGPTTLSDRFFTIKGIGKVGNYNVEVIIKKPIIKSSVASDFAIIF